MKQKDMTTGFSRLCEIANQFFTTPINGEVFQLEPVHFNGCNPCLAVAFILLVIKCLGLKKELNSKAEDLAYVEEIKNKYIKMLFAERNEKIRSNESSSDSDRCGQNDPEADQDENVNGEKTQKPNSHPRRKPGFVGKTLAGISKLVLYYLGTDEEPMQEGHPDYPHSSDGEPMKPAGTKQKTVLRYIREQIIVVVYTAQHFVSKQKINGKYEHATRKSGDTGMFKGSPINPESEFIVALAFRKFMEALPVNRQAKSLEYAGISISRNTLSYWLNTTAENFLVHLIPLFIEVLRNGFYAHADETVVNQQKEKNTAKTSEKHYMFVTSTLKNAVRKVAVYYAGNGTRCAVNAEDILGGFKGVLISDGTTIYNVILGAMRAFCLAHARRKFYECLPTNNDKAVNHPAYKAVELFDKIFKYEREFSGLTAEERKEMRIKHELPILESIVLYCDEQQKSPGYSRKSALHTAIDYFLGNKEELMTFLSDGNIPVTNMMAEHLNKPLKIGLKNYLFFGSKRGAFAAGVYYTIFETARLNHLDPQDYMNYVLKKMKAVSKETLQDRSFLETLLPWNPEVMRNCVDAQHKEEFTEEYIQNYQKQIEEEIEEIARKHQTMEEQIQLAKEKAKENKKQHRAAAKIAKAESEKPSKEETDLGGLLDTFLETLNDPVPEVCLQE